MTSTYKNSIIILQQTPFGQIRYSIIGDDNAVNLFSIDEQTGRIVVVGDLSQQNVEEYRVSQSSI